MFNEIVQDYRAKLLEKMDEDPKAVLKELEQNPLFLKALLSDSERQKTQQELQNERNEKIRYIQMTSQMQAQLKEKADALNTSQGLLIGLGLLWFLSKLE